MAEESLMQPFWLVGASFKGKGDQLARFVEEGIWETDTSRENQQESVKEVNPGERIVVKSAYTRKHNLPFDARGNTVATMAIKAVGTVLENMGDGLRLRVQWDEVYDAPKEWYFYTFRHLITLVNPTDGRSHALYRFVFDNEPQDYDYFRNHPNWRERFGEKFAWVFFYEEFADKLLTFQDRRDELLERIRRVNTPDEIISVLNEVDEAGDPYPMTDICPFTVMALFNRGIKDETRTLIAEKLGRELGVSVAPPTQFVGIPYENNQNTWFFQFEKRRDDQDIDRLWKVFAAGLAWADADEAHQEDMREELVKSYDAAAAQHKVGWRLTVGLFRARPHSFVPLDSSSRQYIESSLNIDIGRNGPKNRCSGEDYLELLDTLNERFEDDDFVVHSFPELSVAAYEDTPEDMSEEDGVRDDIQFQEDEAALFERSQPYTLDNIHEDGSFLERDDLEQILTRLKQKKNIILQGPPGTGKTWLAQRMAFALIGAKKRENIRAIQFHPNMSYEDFVRGYRPSGEGRLTLKDGPFLEMAKRARENPDENYVIVIEEINRGNPAQIFGELLTLLEADKRSADAALTLSYMREGEDPFYLPPNLHVIGTMNIADRSLALVDLALRRRFAFITMKPSFNDRWRAWLQNEFDVPVDVIDTIQQTFNTLNQRIQNDPMLGEQYNIGHSYVTPTSTVEASTDAEWRTWLRDVIETEVLPLLEEYWSDHSERLEDVRAQLPTHVLS